MQYIPSKNCKNSMISFFQLDVLNEILAAYLPGESQNVYAFSRLWIWAPYSKLKRESFSGRVVEWLRRLTRKPKVRTAVGSNPTLDGLVAVRNTSPGRPEPCERSLVAVAGSCGGLMVKHPWSLLEISLPDFRRLATLNINTYLPT